MSYPYAELTIWLLCGVLAAVIYAQRGRWSLVGLLAGLALGPLGVALAFFSSTDKAGVERRQLASGEMKQCPYCAELIRPEATVCRYCDRHQPFER